MVLSLMQLRLGNIELCIGGVERSLGGVVLHQEKPAFTGEGSLALHIVAGFIASRLRRGEPGLSFVQVVALRQRVKLRDEIVRPYHLPNADVTRNHPAVDAECEAFLRSGVDMAGEGYRFSVRAGARSDGPDRPAFGRWLRRVAGTQENQA